MVGTGLSGVGISLITETIHHLLSFFISWKLSIPCIAGREEPGIDAS